MAERAPRPSAQRLSEDIGDVLSAIRRLIAEDASAASSPVEDAVSPQAISDRLWPTVTQIQPDSEDEPAWPLGAFANAPGAPRPDGRSAGMARVEIASHSIDPLRDAPTLAVDLDVPAAPLKLTEIDQAAPDVNADPVMAVEAASGGYSDDEDAFAEAFDWKARMRPEQPPTRIIANESLADAIADPGATSTENLLSVAKGAASSQDLLLCSLPWLDLLCTDPCAEQFGVANDIIHPREEDCDPLADDPATDRADDSIDEPEMHKVLRLIVRKELARALGEFSRNMRHQVATAPTKYRSH